VDSLKVKVDSPERKNNGVRNHFQINELPLIVNILKGDMKRLKVKVEDGYDVDVFDSVGDCG
jgi:hypothetical protein